MNVKAIETQIRRQLRNRLNFLCVRVNSVAWVDQEVDGEFAVIQVPQEFEEAYERVAEIITDPSFPFRITRERAGQRDDFIYLAR